MTEQRVKYEEGALIGRLRYVQKVKEHTIYIVFSAEDEVLMVHTEPPPNDLLSEDMRVEQLKFTSINPCYSLASKIENEATMFSPSSPNGREIMHTHFKFLQFQYYIRSIDGIQLDFEEDQGHKRIKEYVVRELMGDNGLHPLLLVQMLSSLTQA